MDDDANVQVGEGICFEVRFPLMIFYIVFPNVCGMAIVSTNNHCCTTIQCSAETFFIVPFLSIPHFNTVYKVHLCIPFIPHAKCGARSNHFMNVREDGIIWSAYKVFRWVDKWVCNWLYICVRDDFVECTASLYCDSFLTGAPGVVRRGRAARRLLLLSLAIS